MKSLNTTKSFSITAGTALALCVSSSAVFAADINPFGVTELKQGYQLAMGDGEAVEANDSKHAEGKCGESKKTAAEGKCGEGKCGEGKAKAAEGKCGEGKCGEDKKKAAEGKCGEGKCGGSKGE